LARAWGQEYPLNSGDKRLTYPWFDITKCAIRVFDVTLGFVGILLTLPIICFACVGSYCETGSPILRQRRVGFALRSFTIYKIRTLPLSTEWVATHMLDEKISMPGPICLFLRRWKIDELPQLLNVVLGSMSLVGPRPCLLSQADLIAARNEANIYSIRPGITGLAQIRGIDMSAPLTLVKHEIEMIENFSIRQYFSILFRTVRSIS